MIPSVRNRLKKLQNWLGLHENIMELDQGTTRRWKKLTFSQGQFQLLSIARAVASQPKILLLDEITAKSGQ